MFWQYNFSFSQQKYSYRITLAWYLNWMLINTKVQLMWLESPLCFANTHLLYCLIFKHTKCSVCLLEVLQKGKPECERKTVCLHVSSHRTNLHRRSGCLLLKMPQSHFPTLKTASFPSVGRVHRASLLQVARENFSRGSAAHRPPIRSFQHS